MKKMKNISGFLFLVLVTGIMMSSLNILGFVFDPPPTEDTTNPSVSITSPASGSVVSNSITIIASATDNVDVSHVIFGIDGQTLGSDYSPTYTQSLNTASYSNGAHTITAMAIDTSGNYASTSRTIYIENIFVPDEGICWYDYPDGAPPEDPNLWVPEYKDWMEHNRYVEAKDAMFDTNLMSVVFQPIIYDNPSTGTYVLDYVLNVRAETNPGDDDGWPGPTIEDNYGLQCEPTPMGISEIKIETVMVNHATQDENDELVVRDAITNSLAGTHTEYKTDIENRLNNGDFTMGDAAWSKYGMSNGNIRFGTTYGRRYTDMGLRIYNRNDGSIGVYNSYVYNVYGQKNLYMSYWGRRDSSDTGTTVGLDLKIEFTDGTYIWYMPTELRMTYRDNWWHYYEMNYQSDKTINRVTAYALNYEKGYAYFDQIYIATDTWDLQKHGDSWVEGDFLDTYAQWWNRMQTISDYQKGIGVASKVVEYAGTAFGLVGISSAIGKILKVGGYLLDFAKMTDTVLKPFNADNDPYTPLITPTSTVYMDRHDMVPAANSDPLAVDANVRYTYNIYDDSFENQDKISLKIKVSIVWCFIGTPTPNEGFTFGDIADSASIEFTVDLWKYKWY